jgi:16S rRNA (guanine(527)-N(7))-methyltransferase RsmG
MKSISWFVSICAANGLILSDKQAAEFENYLRLLLSWNSRVNLISRKDEANFYSHHALNCVSFLFAHRLNPDAKILDLGTGGGLPGIPLKIIYPSLNLTLIDSIAKKTAVIADMVHQMGLENVEILTGRAEELAKSPELRGKFDYVITRAAGRLDEVAKWSRGFLSKIPFSGKCFEPVGDKMMPIGIIPSGTLIVLKGGAIDDELRAARKIKFVDSIEVSDITFNGMGELENKDKKIILVKYSASEKKN